MSSDLFNFTAGMAGVAIILLIIYLALIVFGIICLVLYIKLATRGIKALDIYIRKNSGPYYQGPQNYYNNQQQYPNQNMRPANPPTQKQE